MTTKQAITQLCISISLQLGYLYFKGFYAHKISFFLCLKREKISQEELSYAAQIPLSQVGRIERGEVNTTISTVLILAKALKVHPKELFEFDI